MKLVVILALFGCALAAPHTKPSRRLGNPDEWGPHYESDLVGPFPVLNKNGILDEAYRWPNGKVAYDFSSVFSQSQKDSIHKAMDHYKTVTGGCIEFIPRTDEHDYLHFQVEGTGCSSNVGKIGGKQHINYPQWCLDSFGSTLHEMYHTLGFYHEQSRFDRDDYVTIHWEHISSGHEHNFNKYDSDYIGGFGEDYDYGSVMHYSKHAFSDDGEVTIETKHGESIGQRVDLSDVDLRKLMNMYKC
ncbi:unnamed protein product [Meganyctiphanes norvegica]|uniref:Metalloendopeptidase n=1 Tax=Meganyctiphanes norvegica TaxID=48144 RepID=A0AAV2RZK0_MEGNR